MRKKKVCPPGGHLKKGGERGEWSRDQVWNGGRWPIPLFEGGLNAALKKHGKGQADIGPDMLGGGFCRSRRGPHEKKNQEKRPEGTARKKRCGA